MLCLCRSLFGLERFSQRRISQETWDSMILGITVLNLIVITVKWRHGQFKYQWRCWTPPRLRMGETAEEMIHRSGKRWCLRKRGGLTSAILQLVWHCDRAVLFVDVFFITPCEGRDLSTPGIVHHFVLVWSMSNWSKLLTVYIFVEPIEKFWRRERKIWDRFFSSHTWIPQCCSSVSEICSTVYSTKPEEQFLSLWKFGPL